MLSLQSLRQLCRYTRSSLRLAEQLSWSAKLPLFLRLCELCHCAGSVIDVCKFGSSYCILEPGRCFVQLSNKPQQSTICYVYIWSTGICISQLVMGISSHAYRQGRDNSRILSCEEISEGGSTPTIQSRELLQELDCCVGASSTTHLFALQEGV